MHGCFCFHKINKKNKFVFYIQDPPVLLEWTRFGDTLDSDLFKPYTSRGSKVMGTIWPAVRHHQDGPVLSRGVADVMKREVVTPKKIEINRIYKRS